MAPKCNLCNDTGEQRYWEGRWRDEKAENERLRAALDDIRTELTRPGSRPAHLIRVCANVIRIVDQQGQKVTQETK